MSIHRLGRNEFYKKRFFKFGTSPAYSGYPSKAHRQEYYQSIAKIMKVDQWSLAHSILEVGCGQGDFYKFMLGLSSVQNLPQRYFQFLYSGIDSVEEVVQTAINCTEFKHGFSCQDLFDLDMTDAFDYVVCVGVLGYDKNIKEYIEKMRSLCKQKVIVQLFKSHPFLESISDVEQIEMIRNFYTTSAIRFHDDSIIWAIEKN